ISSLRGTACSACHSELARSSVAWLVFPEFAKLFLPICAHAHLFPWFDRQRHLCRISLAVLSWKAARNRRIRVTCRSGGIGRRAWFRSMCPQGRGGSSPFFGTITFVILHLGHGDIKL